MPAACRALRVAHARALERKCPAGGCGRVQWLRLEAACRARASAGRRHRHMHLVMAAVGSGHRSPRRGVLPELKLPRCVP
eukprot:1612416-Alexandrium_andersonii.AAC.1